MFKSWQLPPIHGLLQWSVYMYFTMVNIYVFTTKVYILLIIY